MQRDWHDIAGGGALAALGLGVAAHAGLTHDLGTLRQMGPGFFPVLLGVLLAGLGLVIALPAWRRQGTARAFAGREALAVLAAIVVFGVFMTPLGLIATTALAVLIAATPAPRAGWRWRLVLAAAVSLLTWAVFILALKMTIPVWPWSR